MHIYVHIYQFWIRKILGKGIVGQKNTFLFWATGSSMCVKGALRYTHSRNRKSRVDECPKRVGKIMDRRCTETWESCHEFLTNSYLNFILNLLEKRWLVCLRKNILMKCTLFFVDCVGPNSRGVESLFLRWSWDRRPKTHTLSFDDRNEKKLTKSTFETRREVTII